MAEELLAADGGGIAEHVAKELLAAAGGGITEHLAVEELLDVVEELAASNCLRRTSSTLADQRGGVRGASLRPGGSGSACGGS